jgi:type VI secretion system protein VasD
MPECWRLAVRLQVVVCLFAVLAACGTPVARQHSVHLRVVASQGLNPDRDGRPSPVIVRVYQLAEADDFRQAGFFDLYEHDKQLLGKALLFRSVIAVRPGQQLDLDQAMMPNARYLAVLVCYRDIYRARWRSVVELPRNRDGSWQLTLRAGQLSVASLDGKSGTKNGLGSAKEGKGVLEQ